ncbi:MAG: DUF4250 domain-containing protein [Clostridia bacterium]|nr:DUF4250 domain-containing protein [Clostridia bacterium]
MDLPKDPFTLLSFINTKLRDGDYDLEEFCYEYDISISEVEEKLQAIGYKYDKKLNKFA